METSESESTTKKKSFWPTKEEFARRQSLIVAVFATLVCSVAFCAWFHWNEGQNRERREEAYRYMMEERDVTDQIAQQTFQP